MKVVCQRCNTENRAIAKFCIECVNALPTVSGLPDFASTEPAQPRLLSWKLGRGVSGAPWPSVDAPANITAATRARRRLWLGAAAFVLALLVGAAGWLLAGALYISKPAWVDAGAAAPEATAPAPLAAAPVLAPPVQAAAPVPAPAPSAAVPNASVPDAVNAARLARPAAPAATPQARSTPSTAAAAAARTAATPASVPMSVQVPTPPPAPAPAAAARPRAAAEPGAACAGMNFFSAGRCMAEQCQDARFKAHPQCDAVRRQQRLDEERRNPLLAN